MRTTVLMEPVSLQELRPSKAYSKWAELERNDFQKLLKSKNPDWQHRDCPGCGKVRPSQTFFDKDAFNYFKCEHCFTLFVSPVPVQNFLDAIQTQGQVNAFRKTLFSKGISKERIEHVLMTRLRWMSMTMVNHDHIGHLYFDIYSSEPHWQDLVRDNRLFDAAHLLKIEDGLDSLPENIGVLSAFSILDKLSKPLDMLNHLCGKLKPGGLLFLTTSNGSGLEYQLLAEEAPNLNPLDRLTLFSPEGIIKQLQQRGMKMIELSTPGLLDVETIKSFLPGTTRRNLPFWNEFFKRNDEHAFFDFQLFLQKYRLSSHMRAVAIKEK